MDHCIVIFIFIQITSTQMEHFNDLVKFLFHFQGYTITFDKITYGLPKDRITKI